MKMMIDNKVYMGDYEKGKSNSKDTFSLYECSRANY